jgi:DNA-binding MarR family transcriptional regulator
MKDIVSKLNKAFESRVRLGIMSVLTVNEKLDFSSLKELLGATDGNLSSHITALEKEGFIKVIKKFVARKPKTIYSATEKGRKAFHDHLDLLEKIIRKQES